MAMKYTRKVQRKNAGNNTALKSIVLTSAGAQTTSTDGHLRFVMPEAGTYVSTVAALGTVNTGATFIVDVNKNGTTLYTTQTRRPTIAISASPAKSTETATADVRTLAAGDLITVDIDQIGSTIAGSDLSVTFTYLANDV